MQVWTWVLVSCLATVWARPEGGPAPLQAAVVVGDDAADNKAELVVVAEETRPEVLVIDEAKVETSAKEPEDAMQPMPVPIEPGVMTPDDSKVFPEGSLRSPTPAEDSRVLLEEEPAQLPVVNAVEIPVMVAPGAAAAQQGGARMTRASYLPAEARGADSEDIEPVRFQWTPEDGDLGSLGRVLAGLQQVQLSHSYHTPGSAETPVDVRSSAEYSGEYSGLGQYQGGGSYSGSASGSSSAGSWSWSGAGPADAGLSLGLGLGGLAASSDSSYPLFSDRELPDDDGGYYPFAGLGRVELPAQRRTTPLKRVQHPQGPLHQDPWLSDPYQYQSYQPQQYQQPQRHQHHQQQLYLGAYGFDYPVQQPQQEPQAPQLYSGYAPSPSLSPLRRHHQTRPLVFSPTSSNPTAGQYGLLDSQEDDYDDMPPYKSILATLQGDQLDAALAYAGVGGQHSHPALPQGVSFAPYPALPSADSYLSSPFGTFASSALSPAASPVSNEVHSSPDFPVEVRSEAPSASPAADGGVLPVAAAPASSEPSAPAPPAVPAADPALPSFDEIQGLPSPQSTDTAVAEKPLSEDPTEDQDDTVDEESQSDGIPDIYVPDAPTVLVVEDEAGTEAPPAATPEGTAAPEVTTDAVTDDNGGDGESPTDKPTRLVIKPVAKAEAGEDGVAIALPVSQAVVRGNHPVIVDYDPEVSAVAGANGMAHAMGELVLTYVNTTAPPTIITTTSTAAPTSASTETTAAPPTTETPPPDAVRAVTTATSPASSSTPTTPSVTSSAPTTSAAPTTASSTTTPAPPSTTSATPAPTTKASPSQSKKQGLKKKQ